jgi:hypothetical protein
VSGEGRALRAVGAVRRPGRAGLRRRARLSAAVGGLALLLVPSGCSSDDGDHPAGEDASRSAPPVLQQDTTSSAPSPLRQATCPPDAGNCRVASGRVLYVERVDPDGDGDAHFVLASRDSITGPGISVVDVKRSLRPSPLPGPGDRLSAAGPVYRGSYGQRQIEAIELHVAR